MIAWILRKLGYGRDEYGLYKLVDTPNFKGVPERVVGYRADGKL